MLMAMSCVEGQFFGRHSSLLDEEGLWTVDVTELFLMVSDGRGPSELSTTVTMYSALVMHLEDPVFPGEHSVKNN